MLFTGTINTILNKLQDLTCVENCDSDIGERQLFEQPIWQTLNMFIGEALCLLVFYASYMLESRHRENDFDQESDTVQQQISSESPGIEMTGKANLLLWIPTLCMFLFLILVRRLNSNNPNECWSYIHFSIYLSNAKRIGSSIHWHFIIIIFG